MRARRRRRERSDLRWKTSPAKRQLRRDERREKGRRRRRVGEERQSAA